MKFALMLPCTPSPRWKQAVQIGVNHAITSVERTLNQADPAKYEEVLAKITSDFAQAGLKLAGLESHPINAHRIRLGLPGRNEDLDKYCRVIEAAGKVGIPMICYNFMALGVRRTRVDLPERGGALTTGFDLELARNDPPTEYGEVTAEQMWDNLTYFLKRVVPVAEKAGVKLALHPDDPPMTPLRRIARILINAEAFRRVLRTVESPANGIAFCQANFKLMGEDVNKLVLEFGKRRKIFFVHFRDVQGTAQKFVETFHDNGPSDMVALLKLYHQVGFDGPIRPDHAPTLEGEANEVPGYAMLGRMFAIGYMKGIAQASGIPVE
jgi:mannonate dehydratase